jgi:tRNA-Thr(GGU) m(6)t(6)A37 methyltransferase TsaA
MQDQESISNLVLMTMNPIGLIHTRFLQAKGTPIQSAVSDGSEGVIELFPEFTPGLRDLEGFERVWLIYLLNRASAPQLLARPYLDDQEHGIFATRAPARPNRIGLSAVRLLGVERNRLFISEVDILDGTPLLDIKPYIPAFDCFEVTRIGWFEGKSVQREVADDRFETQTLNLHKT